MTKSLNSILVPIDGSQAAIEGLRFAEILAGATGASLHILHVLDRTMLELLRVNEIRDDHFGGISKDELETLAERHLADPYFEAAKMTLNNDSMTVEFRAAHGTPAAEICRYASDGHIDLIVMGSKGATDMQEMLLGSVTSHVVHFAPCPVTVVPNRPST